MILCTIYAIHVFFKKHKFKKHEAQNAEILRNILEKLPGFFPVECFPREDCKRVLHKFPEGFFYIKKNQTKSYSKSGRHLYWKIGSVYLKFEKKITEKNKQSCAHCR